MNVNRAASVTLALLLLSSAGAAQQESKSTREAYTAVASNISEIARAGITPLDIVIERWTDAGENEKLMTAFDEKGQAGLVDALQNTDAVARIRTPGSLSYDFHYARQMTEKNGVRRILLITDRPISFGELTNRGRSLDYPFALIDLRIDASGRGEGKMFLATKIIRTGDLFVLENFATQPVVLSDVKRQKKN
jgi:hypothetical protein